MLLLSENHRLSVEQICDKQGISRRNFYYYLEFFRDSGFLVNKNGSIYSIDRESPFFRHLFETINFTEDEALTMLNVLDKVDDRNALTERIRRKLDRFYDLNILSNPDVKLQRAHNVSVIYNAIKGHQLVKICSYSSPHSNTSSDRIVEPFLFMNNNNEIRAYEPASGMNKTFKVSRMGDVKLLDLSWEHEERHKQVFTDIFLFSGEETSRIQLILDRLAYNLLMEEYPQAYTFVNGLEDGRRWMLDINVVSYLGPSRFVLGLYDNIEIVGDDGFKDFMRNRIEGISRRLPL